MESWEVGGLEGVLNIGQHKPMNHHKVLGEGKGVVQGVGGMCVGNFRFSA